ncbi:hypothetical protein ACS0TY_001783 [Phlomoides rotata]
MASAGRTRKLQDQPGPEEAADDKEAEEKLQETKSETSNKVPKHVRVMQEERLRKDEEEWRRQVEREREKDKKQEGKLLTGKQTEEACCLDARRKQILASASFPLTPGESSGAPAKRPLYQKKKSKPQTQSNGAAILDSVNSTDSKEIPQEIVVELDSGEPENVEKVEFGTRKDKTEIADIVEENGFNDDDEEWDAKNWDKADLKLQGKSAFSDVEVDSEPELCLRKRQRMHVLHLNLLSCPQPSQSRRMRSLGKGILRLRVMTRRLTKRTKKLMLQRKHQKLDIILRTRALKADVKLDVPGLIVDRLYGWKTQRNALIGTALKQQSRDVISDFKRRVTDIITQFMEQGVNTEVYNKNKDREEYHSIVPTSAVSSEGIPQLWLLLVQWAQKRMTKRLAYSKKCTVLEVKVIEGHGATIDVILVSGVLHEGDQIVVCGLQGPIVTNIRALLTPHPMRELQVKGTYLYYKEITAAQGIKITAQGLENATAGASLYIVGARDDLEEIKELSMEDMKSLLEFLKAPAVNIPVSVTPEARELVDELGVKIFLADIIYHLKKEAAEEAVFPCVLKIMPNCVFNKKDPIVLGVDVLDGILKIIGNNYEEQQKMFCRHLEIEDELVNKISGELVETEEEFQIEAEFEIEEEDVLVQVHREFSGTPVECILRGRGITE